jgi:hypothetical protein
MKMILLGIAILLFLSQLRAQAPDTIWTKTFGGLNDETPACIQITVDNGFIILGTTQSYGAGQQDIYLLKTDSSGNEEWSKTYGGSSWDEGSYILTTDDGGYLLMGWTLSITPGKIWLLRLNSIGDTLWTKHFGGGNWDGGSYMIETSDEGYAIVGYTYSFANGQSDLWIIKIDSFGNKLWDKIYGGLSYDYGASIIQILDEGYFILGSARTSDTSDPEIWLIRTDSNGDSLWSKKYGIGIGESIIETSDGNYLITASHPMFINSKIIKINSEGNILWSKSFKTSLDLGNSIVRCPDDGFIIAGYTSMLIYGQSDLAVTKINTDGDILWTKILGGLDQETGRSICKTVNSEYIILGSTNAQGTGGTDLWLLLLGKENPSDIEYYPISTNSFSLLQNCPNPFNPSTKIRYSITQSGLVTLKVFDVLGNEIAILVNQEMNAGSYQVNFNANNLASGVYIYQIKSGGFISSKKMILLK